MPVTWTTVTKLNTPFGGPHQWQGAQGADGSKKSVVFVATDTTGTYDGAGGFSVLPMLQKIGMTWADNIIFMGSRPTGPPTPVSARFNRATQKIQVFDENVTGHAEIGAVSMNGLDPTMIVIGR